MKQVQGDGSVQGDNPPPVTVEEFNAALKDVIVPYYLQNNIGAVIVSSGAGIVPLTVDVPNAIHLARRMANKLEKESGA